MKLEGTTIICDNGYTVTYEALECGRRVNGWIRTPSQFNLDDVLDQAPNSGYRDWLELLVRKDGYFTGGVTELFLLVQVLMGANGK